jgi:hypothetical protein
MDDLEVENAAYYASADRRGLNPDPARHLAETETWVVEPLEAEVDR